MDGAQKKPESSSPGNTLLNNTVSVQVAGLGQPYRSTVSHGFIAEAALEARGTCTLLAHPSTARTVVTQTMDTATVCKGRDENGETGQEAGLVRSQDCFVKYRSGLGMEYL